MRLRLTQASKACHVIEVMPSLTLTLMRSSRLAFWIPVHVLPAGKTGSLSIWETFLPDNFIWMGEDIAHNARIDICSSFFDKDRGKGV